MKFCIGSPQSIKTHLCCQTDIFPMQCFGSSHHFWLLLLNLSLHAPRKTESLILLKAVEPLVLPPCDQALNGNVLLPSEAAR